VLKELMTVNPNATSIGKVLGKLAPVSVRFKDLKRFGSKHDGGYVILNDITNRDFLLSFGVGDNVDFEEEFSKICSGSHLYDHSIPSLPKQIENTVFYNEFIGRTPDIDLKTAISRLPQTSNLILKIDIEGSEWQLLADATEQELNLFRQIIIEFHNISKLTNPLFAAKAESVINKLSNLFWIINIHGNNNGDYFIIENTPIPDVIEVSFLNKSLNPRVGEQQIVQSEIEYFSKLNSPCNPEIPEIVLPDFQAINTSSANTNPIGAFSVHEVLNLREENISLKLKFIDFEVRIESLKNQFDNLINSTIWRATGPIRDIVEFFKKLR
jgi:hypothetical protein